VLAENLAIHPVHRLEVTKIRQEHSATQNVGKITSCGFQNSLHVPKDLLGLSLYIQANDLSCSRVGGTLARHEDQPLEDHSWGVGTDGFGEASRNDGGMCRLGHAILRVRRDVNRQINILRDSPH